METLKKLIDFLLSKDVRSDISLAFVGFVMFVVGMNLLADPQDIPKEFARIGSAILLAEFILFFYLIYQKYKK